MVRRKTMLNLVASAIPTSGDNVVFASVHRGTPGRLEAGDLPAAIVRRADEEVQEDQRGYDRASGGFAIRKLRVEIDVVMKNVTGLDDAMDDYLEAIEAAVLYDSGVQSRAASVLPGGSSEIDYDDESEEDVAKATLFLDIDYNHWPADPSVTPVEDPYDPQA